MRVALCTLIALIGMAQVGHAADTDKDKKIINKTIKIPSLDFNGYSAQFNTDLSRQQDTFDPPGTSQFRNDNVHPYFGLKFSKPLK
jgi:hypothetical protein